MVTKHNGPTIKLMVLLPTPGLPEGGEAVGASAGGIGDTPGANLQGVESEGWVGARGAWVQGLGVGFHRSHRDGVA